MNKIQMVDLNGQYRKIKDEVDHAVLDVIESAAFINGPAVKQFQNDLETYLGTKHVIPCANGTDALQVALMALDLEPGDEVITSNFTFAATVEVVYLLGLKAVLVDVEPDTFNICPKSLERAITPRTKVIVPVHLFGQCANYEAVAEIAKKHNLYIVEDTAQAIGAEYTFKDGSRKKAGTMGHIGTTSFFPSKNLGCYGDGGAIYTDDDALATKMRSLVNHGMGKRYYYDDIGINSRLDTIQAAILGIKLKHLDEYAAARNRAADYYDAAFASEPKLTVPYRAPYSTHVFHQYTLRTHGVDRNAMQEFLQGKDIPAMIYYPMPLHVQEAYKQPEFGDDLYPVTIQLCKEVISLPMHTELSEEQLRFITDSVKEFLNR
jgi:UDP-2-acetamido-2-deoxy-ribo-hexuluronate aminotransferase